MSRREKKPALPTGEPGTIEQPQKRTNENAPDRVCGSSEDAVKETATPRDSTESKNDIPDVAEKGLIFEVQEKIAVDFRDNPALSADQELSQLFLEYECNLDEINQAHEGLRVFKSNLDSYLSAWQRMILMMCTQSFARKRGLDISVVFRHCQGILEQNRISFVAANQHHPSSLLTAKSPEHLDWSYAMKNEKKLVTLIEEANLNPKAIPDLAMSLKELLDKRHILSESDCFRKKCLIPSSLPVDESLLMVCICRYHNLEFEYAKEIAEQLFSKMEHLSWPNLYTLEQKEKALSILGRICAKFDSYKSANLENLSESQTYALEDYPDFLDCGLEAGMDRITSMESRCKESESNIKSAKYHLAQQIMFFFYLMGGCSGRRLISSLEKRCRDQLWDAVPEECREEYNHPDRAYVWNYLLRTESGLRDALTSAEINFADVPFLVNSVYVAMDSIEVVKFPKEFFDDMNAVPVFREIFSDDKQKRLFEAICSWQKVEPEITEIWLFQPGKYMCA